MQPCNLLWWLLLIYERQYWGFMLFDGRLEYVIPESFYGVIRFGFLLKSSLFRAQEENCNGARRQKWYKKKNGELTCSERRWDQEGPSASGVWSAMVAHICLFMSKEWTKGYFHSFLSAYCVFFPPIIVKNFWTGFLMLTCIKKEEEGEIECSHFEIEVKFC